MDELDNIGARSGDFVNAIDSRVLTAFLAEIDGLEAAGNLLLIGATNRADLLDEALLRPGRFGDRVFQIPRPSRDAAREIFGKHVTPNLPFSNGNGASAQAMAEELIEAAVCHIYSPRGEGNLLATLTLRDGKRQQVHAPEVMSGALIANVVREAKRRSCARGARGGQVGIAAADVLDAVDGELETIAQRLKKTRYIHALLTELPADVDVVKVEIHTRSRAPRTHDFVHSGA
jgi:proteasome-associated ATPase